MSRWPRSPQLSTGACWLQAGGTAVLGLYRYEDENIIEVQWLDGIKSRSGTLAFADLLQRGVVTFCKPMEDAHD